MPALNTAPATGTLNPLDLIEQIAVGLDWNFDRCTDTELAAEAPGKWCTYGLFFSWSTELSAIHFTCAFDLKVSVPKRKSMYELIALANEHIWIGHFSLDQEDGILLFRHALLLRGIELNIDIFEDLIDIALTECERLYPAFQFFLWGGQNPAEAVKAAMLNCAGEA
ncbi:type III secretion system chaperone family protein [Acetobacter thailandicus]|uniref:YbjN domain-containing protein n=1 Tax=Acetobacter thailandicus TaxID=1502842 RepID=UPI001BA87F4F|nr:YbjN domain-containing protein [Acetobacter thailandicus]MBS0986165.1 YbjN domain-containing protein [Acetobacter thailandicus]